MRKGSAVGAERDEINACPAPGAPSGAATKQTVDALLGRPDPTGQSTASAASTPAEEPPPSTLTTTSGWSRPYC